jgi:hypothetical protein
MLENIGDWPRWAEMEQGSAAPIANQRPLKRQGKIGDFQGEKCVFK